MGGLKGASLDNPRLCKMTDRRRINGPSGGSSAPIYSKYIQKDAASQTERPSRIRQPNVLRKMFLKTGVTPSASGSAYLDFWTEAHMFRSRSPPTSQERSLLSPYHPFNTCQIRSVCYKKEARVPARFKRKRSGCTSGNCSERCDHWR